MTVASSNGEPVNGGIVTFTGPYSCARIVTNPVVVTIATGQASICPVANNIVGGNYTVTAAIATGATPASVAFTLTNTPLISGVNLNSGPVAGGMTVTITGAGFDSWTTVTFGGLAATTIDFVDSTKLRAKTPAHPAGTVDVAVTTNGVTATLPQAYTYGTATTLPPSQPTVGTGGPTSPLPSPRAPGPTGGTAPDPRPNPRP